MKTFTRDETEHGQTYVLESDARAEIDLLEAQVRKLKAAVRDAALLADFAEIWITDPAIEGAQRLKGGGDRFRALLSETAAPPGTRSDAIATVPALMAALDVDHLAQAIRIADGNHSLGAGALAEKLVELFQARSSAAQQLWNDAYTAFVGAFDTPVARRAISGDFAQDARRRMREINESVAFAHPRETTLPFPSHTQAHRPTE